MTGAETHYRLSPVSQQFCPTPPEGVTGLMTLSLTAGHFINRHEVVAFLSSALHWMGVTFVRKKTICKFVNGPQTCKHSALDIYGVARRKVHHTP